MIIQQLVRRMHRAAMRRLAAPAALAMAGLALAAVANGQVVAPGAVAPGGAYGVYGWGGWGSAASTVGDAARGLGALAQGIGAGDRLSAEADAIRTETWTDLNEYLYRSRMLHLQQYRAEEAADQAARDQARNELDARALNDPTPEDIESGDTLNRILFQLDAPKIPASLVRDASQGMTLPGATVQKIPFMFSHKGAAFSLQRLNTEGEGWPSALRADALAPLRQRYEQTIERILQVPDGEPVPMELIAEARATLGEMYRTIEAAQLDGPVAAEAMRHLRDQAGMVAMLKEPDVKQVLDEAAGVEQVDLPNLLNFMRVFNLQFGAADTPEEKALYSQQLYPMLASARDNLAPQLSRTTPDAPGGQEQPQYAASPGGAFEGFDWEQLGITSGNPPAPGAQPSPSDTPAPAPRRGAPGVLDPGNN